MVEIKTGRTRDEETIRRTMGAAALFLRAMEDLLDQFDGTEADRLKRLGIKSDGEAVGALGYAMGGMAGSIVKMLWPYMPEEESRKLSGLMQEAFREGFPRGFMLDVSKISRHPDDL